MKPTAPEQIRSVVLEVCVFGTLVLLLLHATGYSIWAGKPDLFAVIIGISEYDDPRIRPVKHALDDARDVQSFIQEQQRQRKLFGGTHVKALFDAKATKENILEALKTHLAAAQSEDIVIIYFSGHGERHTDDKHYFLLYDTDSDDIAGTAIPMGDPTLVEHVQSERVLLVADACKSGGLISTIGKGKNRGRFALAAAAPDEDALSSPDFRNGIFTYYFLKGLRGAAASNTNKTVITVKSLFDYVFSQTRQAAVRLGAVQTPQLYGPPDLAATTPVYLTEEFKADLNVQVKLFYEDDGSRLREITDESMLKSGQRFGVAFRPDADCYLHIFCWDTSGQVRRLFPNPALTEGSGFVRAGETVWLPSRGGKHWYVLDSKPGRETIYLVASRHRNQTLEGLYGALEALSPQQRLGEAGRKLAARIEREVNLMDSAALENDRGASSALEPKSSLLETFERRLRVEGAEAFRKWQFEHASQ